jgi:hypothetical protein
LSGSPLLWFCLFLSHCATLPPTHRPLRDEEIATVISSLRRQQEKVTSFYALGSVSVKKGLWESEADILVIGEKKPLALKIEITHPWGQPILHILINKGRIEAFSYPEKKLYVGVFSPQAVSRFIPGKLDPTLVWALMRGYPPVRDHARAVATAYGQILLLDRQGKEVERIGLQRENLDPFTVTFPENGIRLELTEIQEQKSIRFARRFTLESMEDKRDMIVLTKKVVFNRPIPNGVFSIKKPPPYETHYLND